MPNPIHQILSNKEPFTFFHTHVLDREVMDQILAAHKTFEIDIAFNDKGEPHVGHAPSHYIKRNLPMPNNLSIEEAVSEGVKAELFMMLDVKHVDLLPLIKKIITRYGSEHFLVHAFCKELSFKPYPAKVKAVEGVDWDNQELPLKDLLELKQAISVPLVLSCHGITQERLEAEGQQIYKHIIGVAESKVDIVNLFMPRDETPPLDAAALFLEHDLISLIPVDRTPAAERPATYFGATDILEHAT